MTRQNFVRSLSVAFLSIVLVSCSGHTKPVPNPIVITDSDKCGAACKHLVDIGCDIGKVLPDGTTCQQMCEYIQSQGVWLNPTCVMSAKTCDDVEPVCAEGRATRMSIANDKCLWLRTFCKRKRFVLRCMSWKTKKNRTS